MTESGDAEAVPTTAHLSMWNGVVALFPPIQLAGGEVLVCHMVVLMGSARTKWRSSRAIFTQRFTQRENRMLQPISSRGMH